MKKSIAIYACLCAGLAAAQTQKVGWSLGYYAAWDQGKYPPASIKWKSFTHISQFAITPKNDGSIDAGANGLNDAYCKAAVAEAHKNGVKILICVGGAGVGDGFKYACSNANRGKFISALISFMKKYGYDGIDTDWEENFDNALFVTWHKELRDSLDLIAPRPLLTLAAEDWFATPTGLVWQYVDFMNDMCYSTKASGLGNVLGNLVKVGVPKAKLGGGMGMTNEGGMAIQDSNSAKDFCKWIIANGYGGVMAWSVTGGNTQTVYSSIAQFVPDASSAVAGPGASAYADAYTLQVRDNPLTGRREIFYTVAGNAGAVRLGLYDLGGALMKSFAAEARPGAYAIPLSADAARVAEALRPGAYVVRMETPAGLRAARALVGP